MLTGFTLTLKASTKQVDITMMMECMSLHQIIMKNKVLTMKNLMTIGMSLMFRVNLILTCLMAKMRENKLKTRANKSWQIK